MSYKHVICVIFSVLALCACAKVGPVPVKFDSLEKLYEQLGPESTKFELNVKNMVVACVADSHAMLQDESAGVYLKEGYSALSVGTAYAGNIAGKGSLVDGSIVLDELDLSKASPVAGSSVRPAYTTLKTALSNPAKYSHRLLVLQGVTFVDGLEGKYLAEGGLSSSGAQTTVVNWNAAVSATEGWHGDIGCFLHMGKFHVYDDSDFEKYPYSNPFMAQTRLGIYELESDEDAPVQLYRFTREDQNAYGQKGAAVFNNFQNYKTQWFVGLRLDDATLKVGARNVMTMTVFGTDIVESGSGEAYIEKIKDGKAWVRDFENKKGYIISIL